MSRNDCTNQTVSNSFSENDILADLDTVDKTSSTRVCLRATSMSDERVYGTRTRNGERNIL